MIELDNNTGDLVNENIENVTIRQYLNNHFLHSSQGYKVADRSHFNGELRFNYSSNALLEKYIPTLSAFKSLIEATLFGGDNQKKLNCPLFIIILWPFPMTEKRIIF